MAKKTIEDIQVNGKKVLCRVDFNVPLSEDGKVSDDKRIVAALPTIQYLLAHQAKVILCSHLGRPKGKVDMKYSLKPVAERLAELLPGVRVQFASDTVGESAHKCIDDMKDGEIVLLENTLFQKEEEANDPAFAKQLADLADIFVSDAFGTFTEPMLPLQALLPIFLPWPGSLLARNWASWGKRWKIRFARSLLFWAVPR